jgi:predicted XRE-type DNA-binding protein
LWTRHGGRTLSLRGSIAMSMTLAQRERARLLFKAIYEFRRSYEPCGFKQTYIAEVSGIGQPTISKILNAQIEPTEDQLNRLFEGLGLKLDNLLAEWHPKNRLLGYLATPLTNVVNQPNITTLSVYGPREVLALAPQ